MEPRHAEIYEILYNELDEFYEFIFFTKGAVDIGFEINKKRYYGKRLSYAMHIGSLGCTYNHDSEFIYRAGKTCSGYSIRKHNWQHILEHSPNDLI